MSKLRRTLYRTAADLGDIESLTTPEKAAKRQVRKAVYRHTGRATRNVLRMFGL